MSSGTASALISTGPRRARAAAVDAGGFPGSKITEVDAVPLVTVVVVVEVLVVFKTEMAVVVVGCMPRKDEQNGVALCNLSTSMTTTTLAHCCGVRFRASMPLLGAASTDWTARQSAATAERKLRMTARHW